VLRVSCLTCSQRSLDTFSDVATQPKKMLNTVTLTKDFRRVAKTIMQETKDYRPDLQKGEFFWTCLRVQIRPMFLALTFLLA